MEVYCDHKTIEEVLKMQFNEPVETYAAPPKSGVLIEEIDDEGRVIEEPCTDMVLTKKPLNAETQNQKKSGASVSENLTEKQVQKDILNEKIPTSQAEIESGKQKTTTKTVGGVGTSKGRDNDAADDTTSSSDNEQFNADDNFCRDDLMFEDAGSIDETENDQQSVGRQQQEHEDVTGTSNIPTQQSQKKGKKNKARQPATFGSKSIDVGAAFDGDKIDDQLDSGEESSEERGGHIPKFIDFIPERDMKNPRFFKGQRFANSREFKEALKNYAIVNGKPVKPCKNERKRVRAKW